MQPTITTPRLVARPLSPDDARPLHRIWGDPEVIWWGANDDLDATADALARILDRTRELPEGLGWWLVVRGEDVVGDVVLQVPRWDPDVVEVGWHLAREHWGHGYATEAAWALLDHGFRTLRLPSVDAIVAERNTRSHRVAQRLGMTRIGTLEHADLPHVRYRVDAGGLPPAPDVPAVAEDLEHSSRAADEQPREPA